MKQGPGVDDVLMPSTPLAYPQVAWRRFASFRAANFRISAVHAALCAWFDSRQLHKKTGQAERLSLFSLRPARPHRHVRPRSLKMCDMGSRSIVNEFDCGRSELVVVLEDRAVAGVRILPSRSSGSIPGSSTGEDTDQGPCLFHRDGHGLALQSAERRAIFAAVARNSAAIRGVNIGIVTSSRSRVSLDVLIRHRPSIFS